MPQHKGERRKSGKLISSAIHEEFHSNFSMYSTLNAISPNNSTTLAAGNWNIYTLHVHGLAPLRLNSFAREYHVYATRRPMKIKNWIGHRLHSIVSFFRRGKKEKRLLCTKGKKKEKSRHWQRFQWRVFSDLWIENASTRDAHRTNALDACLLSIVWKWSSRRAFE